MDRVEAKEVLRNVLDIISQNLHYLEDSGAEKFLDESLPAMYLIERLRDEFLLYGDGFELKESEYQTDDPVVYLVFLSMSNFDPIEIFEVEQGFLDWLEEDSELGKEFVDDVEEYDQNLQDRTLDFIASYMRKFKEDIEE